MQIPSHILKAVSAFSYLMPESKDSRWIHIYYVHITYAEQCEVTYSNSDWRFTLIISSENFTSFTSVHFLSLLSFINCLSSSGLPKRMGLSSNLILFLLLLPCPAPFPCPDMHLHYGDMTDSSSLVKIISIVRPSEIYNLAAQSHVKVKQSDTRLILQPCCCPYTNLLTSPVS